MKKSTFLVSGMHCAGCAANIEKAVKKMPGVEEAYVNFAAGKLTASFDEKQLNDDAIIAEVARSGYQAALPQPEKTTLPDDGIDPDAWRFPVAAVFAVLLSYVGMHEMLHLPFWEMPAGANAFLQIALLAPVVIAGFGFYSRGFRSLFRAAPDMDSLIATGTSAAVFYSLFLCLTGHFGHLYFEAAGMIIALIMLGKFLEGRSRRKASGAIRELMKLAPETAILITPEGDREIAAREIQPGNLLRVRPGDRIPVDGVIKTGTGSVDESMLTGESMPVDKEPGNTVTGGSVNRNGSFEVEAERIGADTVLARIIKLVEDAQGSRPPIARLADVISGWFVWAVLSIAAVTFIGWMVHGDGVSAALGYALAVLVIACPCALGLATPIALIVGIGQGARYGILIKSGAVLENAGKIGTVVFDKTGTLTLGQPVVNEILVVPDSGYTAVKLLRIAASAEKNSSHPLALAVMEKARQQQIVTQVKIEDFQYKPGFGVSCTADGKSWFFGNRRMMDAESVEFPDGDLESYGAQSIIYAAADRKLVGMLAVGDRPKPGAAEAIAQLHELGVHTVMLTGDNREAAEAIASTLAVDEFRAELLPGDKSGVIQKLQKESGMIVAMVGDGINDAPALAQADVGIAIGSGTDIAMETADVVLLKGDLNGVASAIRLSRSTMRIIKENLFWAFFYNAVGIPLAAGVFTALFGGPSLNPVFGALAMAASSVSVVLNALRLRHFRP